MSLISGFPTDSFLFRYEFPTRSDSPPPFSFISPIESVDWGLAFYAGYRRGSFDPSELGYLIPTPVSNSDSLSGASSDFLPDAASPDMPQEFLLGDAHTSSVLTGLNNVDIEEHCGFNPIDNFRSYWTVGADKPDSYNDDLFMSRLESSKHIWDGEKNRELAFNINDDTSDTDRAVKAILEPCYL